ncbi:hypothetical protein SETIT_1G006500v2 [Setaria italica]|uniref:Uncharacterized protein n=1 Tax=Setaria italica TaxID=4555 RepID=A0A368PG01_SETIT|nr:hypothetical protein SETIT_1G006500v2 [Setaria italica]
MCGRRSVRGLGPAAAAALRAKRGRLDRNRLRQRCVRREKRGRPRRGSGRPRWGRLQRGRRRPPTRRRERHHGGRRQLNSNKRAAVRPPGWTMARVSEAMAACPSVALCVAETNRDIAKHHLIRAGMKRQLAEVAVERRDDLACQEVSLGEGVPREAKSTTSNSGRENSRGWSLGEQEAKLTTSGSGRENSRGWSRNNFFLS